MTSQILHVSPGDKCRWLRRRCHIWTKCRTTTDMQGETTKNAKVVVYGCDNQISEIYYNIRHLLFTSDGQIQIMIRFRWWLNHTCWFDLSTRFDLETCDLIWIWFQLMWFNLWCDQITNFSKLGQRFTFIMMTFHALYTKMTIESRHHIATLH